MAFLSSFASQSDGSSTVTDTGVIIPAAATYAIIQCANRGSDANTELTGVTLDGVSFTLDNTTLRQFNGFQAVECGYMLSGDITSGTVTLTSTRVGSTDGFVQVVSFFDDAAQNAPPVTLNGYNSSPPDPVVTSITTTTTNAVILDMIMTANNRTFTVDEVGQTLQENENVSGANVEAWTSTLVVTSSGAYDMGWDTAGNSDRTTHVVLAIEEAASGAFTLTADTAAYTYSGTDASLLLSALLSAETDQYDYTGTSANLLRGANLDAETDSYLYSGTNADLILAALMPAETAQYTYTGTSADIVFGGYLAADTAQYTYAGTETDLVFVGAGDFTLTADTVQYTYSGTNAGLVKASILVTETENYAYTGTAATLTRSAPLPADSGSYTYSGTAAALAYNRIITTDSGSYIYTGNDVTIIDSGAIWVKQSGVSTTWTEQLDTSTTWTPI